MPPAVAASTYVAENLACNDLWIVALRWATMRCTFGELHQSDLVMSDQDQVIHCAAGQRWIRLWIRNSPCAGVLLAGGIIHDQAEHCSVDAVIGEIEGWWGRRHRSHFDRIDGG